MSGHYIDLLHNNALIKNIYAIFKTKNKLFKVEDLLK